MSIRSLTYLLTGATRQRQEAELINGVDDDLLELADEEWQAFLQPILEIKCQYTRLPGQYWLDFVRFAYRHARSLGIPLDDLPEHPHWMWGQKQAEFNDRSYAVQCNGSIQGLMIVSLDSLSRIPERAGQPIVYVDYLATAPWNDSSLVTNPRFRGSGVLLVRAAVQLSLDLGRDA